MDDTTAFAWFDFHIFYIFWHGSSICSFPVQIIWGSQADLQGELFILAAETWSLRQIYHALARQRSALGLSVKFQALKEVPHLVLWSPSTLPLEGIQTLRTMNPPSKVSSVLALMMRKGSSTKPRCCISLYVLSVKI